MDDHRTLISRPRSAFLHVLGGMLLTALVGLRADAALAADCAGQELKAGTVVTKDNIDCLKQSTFHGDKLGDLLTQKVELQVREWGLKLTLADPKPLAIDYRIKRLDDVNRKTVKFNPTTRLVEGWKAGVPFPDVDPSDPNAGIKVAWNYTYGVPRGDTQALYKFVFGLVDGNGGLERVLRLGYIRKYYKGILGEAGPTIGNGDVFDRTLLVFFTPHDVKGIGTLTIRYDTGQLSDIWAYVRSVRRVRRLSGGAWFDPVGGTDVLADNIETFNAYPTWYPSYKVVGKKKILAMAHGTLPAWVENASTPQEQFPRIDLSSAPYWNPIEKWEPQEVWIVETTPPPEHPYSKKICFVDAKAWRPYFMEGYDKKGEFWHFQHYSTGEYSVADDPKGSALLTWVGLTIDFQRKHATFFGAHPSWTMNVPVTDEEVSLGALETGGDLRK